MDSDPPRTPNDGQGDEPAASRLRYDAPHELPPRPMFLRLDPDEPDGQDE